MQTHCLHHLHSVSYLDLRTLFSDYSNEFTGMHN